MRGVDEQTRALFSYLSPEALVPPDHPLHAIRLLVNQALARHRKSKGQPARLCSMGHLLIENRHGLIVDTRTTHATGRAERGAPEDMIAAKPRQGYAKPAIGASSGRPGW